MVKAEAFYRERGARTLFQVTTASAPPSLVPVLRKRGYHATARTLVDRATTADVTARTRTGPYDIELSDVATDEWFKGFWSVEAASGRNASDMAVCRDVLLASELPTVFAAALRGHEVVGVGQLVIERGWGGIQCMATVPGHRRQDVAQAVLHELANEAHRREVESMYLAVMRTNEPAVALYEAAGFSTVHEYSYYAA